MSVCVCSCGGGYQEIRPRHIPCDCPGAVFPWIILQELWGGWGGGGVAGGSSFASKQGQPNQEKLAKFIRACSWAYNDSLPYIFDKLKKRTRLEKSVNQLLERGQILLQLPGSKSAFREQPQ